MPSFGIRDWRDTKRWFACVKKASQAMIAEGWSRHARKFHAVNMRRALQLYKKTS